MPQRESQALADVSSSLNSFTRFLDNYADAVQRHADTLPETRRKPVETVVSMIRAAAKKILLASSAALRESAYRSEGEDHPTKVDADICDCAVCTLFRNLRTAASPEAPTNGHASPEAKANKPSYGKGEPVEFRFDAMLEWRTGRIEGPSSNTDVYLVRAIDGVVYGIAESNIRAVPIAEPASRATSVEDI